MLDCECEGAPRDLGLDQGRRYRQLLGGSFRSRPLWQRALLRLGRGSDAQQRFQQDLRRFFPQQAEATDALATGARLPAAWLLERLASDPTGTVRGECLGLAAARAVSASGPLLARSIPTDAIVRRSKPKGGFQSIEITQPWRTAPLAGVNEAGLAAAVVAEPGEPGGDPACAVPASLLVLDCLARFDGLDGAIDWLLARPGGGNATILLADARGEIAGVGFRGAERTISRPADDLLVRTGGHERHGEIEKGLREASPLVASDLARFLGTELVAIEPDRGRLGWLHRGASDEGDRWFEL